LAAFLGEVDPLDARADGKGVPNLGADALVDLVRLDAGPAVSQELVQVGLGTEPVAVARGVEIVAGAIGGHQRVEHGLYVGNVQVRSGDRHPNLGQSRI